MSLKEYIKDMAVSYFIIVTLIDFAMLLLGVSLEKEASFGYEAFLMPLLYGLLGVLPSFVLYSKREFGIKEMIIRKILHFILLEFVILSFVYVNGLRNFNKLIPVAVSVALICCFVAVISWLLDLKKSDMMTQELKAFQKRKQ